MTFSVLLMVNPILPAWAWMAFFGAMVLAAGLGSCLTWVCSSWRRGSISSAVLIAIATTFAASFVVICCYDCGWLPDWICLSII